MISSLCLAFGPWFPCRMHFRAHPEDVHRYVGVDYRSNAIEADATLSAMRCLTAFFA
jgi:hypothetical protein